MPRETHELNISRETLVGLLSKGVMMALGFAGVVLFANVLGAVGLGAYYLLLTIGRLLSHVADGLSAAIKKRVSEADTDPGEFIGIGLLAHALLVALATGLLLVLAPVIRRLVDAPDLVLGVSIVVLGLGLFTIANQFYAGVGYPGYASWLDTLRSLATLLLQVTLLLAGWGPFGLLLGFAVAGALSGIVGLLVARVRPRFPSQETIRSVWRYARWSIPNAVVSDAYNRVTVIAIGMIVSTAGVGIYESALRLAQPGAFMASSVSRPLEIKVSGRSSRQLDVSSDIWNAVSYAPVIAIPILFGALAMPTALMRTIFGPEFAGGGPVLIGLALFQVFVALNSPLSSTLHGIDRIDSEFRITTLVAVGNGIFAIALTMAHGTIGGVIGILVAEIGRFALYQYYVYQFVGIVVITRPILEQVVSGIAMWAVVVVMTDSVLPIVGWPQLIAAVAVGAVLYGSCLLVISSHFRQTAKEVTADISAHYCI